jgi:2-C-methyl-D-erythritol 4-phosphate cytidylyltransferase
MFTYYRLPWVQSVVVVVSPSDVSWVQGLLEENHLTRVKVTAGGETRHRSIYNGVKALGNGRCTVGILSEQAGKRQS